MIPSWIQGACLHLKGSKGKGKGEKYGREGGEGECKSENGIRPHTIFGLKLALAVRAMNTCRKSITCFPFTPHSVGFDQKSVEC